jgi:hypothetical protein
MNTLQACQNSPQGDKKEKAGKDTGWSENGLKRLFQAIPVSDRFL